MHVESRSSDLKTHFAAEANITSSSPIQSSGGPPSPPCPSAVLFLSRWHISVWIISLLQEAAAPTIFMCVCARLPARAHARAASFLPRLLDAWCLRGRFKAATAMKGGEEKRGDRGKGGCMRMVNERESSRL